MNKHPNILFAARAQGIGKNGLMISLHKNFTDYSNFIANHLLYWGDDIEDHAEILVSLKETIIKPLSLRYLAKLKEPSEN